MAIEYRGHKIHLGKMTKGEFLQRSQRILATNYIQTVMYTPNKLSFEEAINNCTKKRFYWLKTIWRFLRRKLTNSQKLGPITWETCRLKENFGREAKPGRPYANKININLNGQQTAVLTTFGPMHVSGENLFKGEKVDDE